MTTPRIYVTQDLPPASTIVLDATSSHHLLNVLRLQKGEGVLLFNGKGGEVLSHLIEVKQKCAVMELGNWQSGIPESPLFTYLGQGVARGEKMDFIIQKAVELGVNVIAPLITDHGNVKLDPKRAEERLAHWQKIAVHASEQCGRCKIAQILPIRTLSAWVSMLQKDNEFTAANDEGILKLILEPPIVSSPSAVSFEKQNYSFPPACSYQNKNTKKIIFTAGSEGGFSLREKTILFEHHFSPCLLGPRILRAETAALVALSIFQARWGDIAGESNEKK